MMCHASHKEYGPLCTNYTHGLSGQSQRIRPNDFAGHAGLGYVGDTVTPEFLHRYSQVVLDVLHCLPGHKTPSHNCNYIKGNRSAQELYTTYKCLNTRNYLAKGRLEEQECEGLKGNRTKRKSWRARVWRIKAELNQKEELKSKSVKD